MLINKGLRVRISTHAPLARCNGFLTTVPARYARFLLTHLLRGATEMERSQAIYKVISTHAPLARCNKQMEGAGKGIIISTHAPLARCNFSHLSCFHNRLQFLLTHLLRGATDYFLSLSVFELNFYSRTSCEVQHKSIK